MEAAGAAVWAGEAGTRTWSHLKPKARMVKSIPYAGAQSGAAARDEITKVLRRFGCESVGTQDRTEGGWWEEPRLGS